jgi:hypothetical protein
MGQPIIDVIEKMKLQPENATVEILDLLIANFKTRFWCSGNSAATVPCIPQIRQESRECSKTYEPEQALASYQKAIAASEIIETYQPWDTCGIMRKPAGQAI